MITKINVKDRTITSYAIRKLTPRECFRLMGVREEVINIMLSSVTEAKARIGHWFNKRKDEEQAISQSQCYKQAGNSIVVGNLVGIFENLYYPTDKRLVSEENGVKYTVDDEGQMSFSF